MVSAVPLCHGIGLLRGLEMVEVPGATGVEQEGDRVPVVAPGGGEGLVVAEEQDPVVLPGLLQPGEQGGDQAAVQPLDGLDLAGQIAVVGALVGGLQVEADEVVLPELRMYVKYGGEAKNEQQI